MCDILDHLVLAALLVAVLDLFTISWSPRVLDHWAPTPQSAKVQCRIVHRGH